MRLENCSADGKWQDFSGNLLPCATDAQRSQPVTYDKICLLNFDGFCRASDVYEWEGVKANR
jgi:hypothetical protein